VLVIRTPDERLTWLQALGSRRKEAVSGHWHTQRTLAHWCRIRSYLDSARNHGLRALNAIRAALKGKPWIPPLPALA
jgi:transposase